MTIALDSDRRKLAEQAAATPLPERWFPLRYHEIQSRLWRTRERNVLVCAGRGSGKTELARRRIVRMLRVAKEWRDPRYFYALPTYAQARRVAREHILSLVPRSWLVKPPGESAMEFKTVFGSWLFIVGMDKPQRVEGDQYDGGVVDESSDQKPGVYRLTLRPALTHREGWLWRIGVPKRYGVGAGEFKQAFTKGVDEGRSFTWPSWDILPESEIAIMREELGEKDFDEQLGGRWVDAGGLAYYSFGKENVDELGEIAEYDPSRMIYASFDFNVDPMAWVLAHRDADTGRLLIFDEVWKRNTNTREAMNQLHGRYGTHKSGWTFTGDASAGARKTSSTTTDRAILANDMRFNARMRFDNSNPHVKDRVEAVNAVCKSKGGEVKLLVAGRCQHLIADLANRAIDEWGVPCAATPGQEHDSGHATDALGYLVWKYSPLRARMTGRQLVVVG